MYLDCFKDNIQEKASPKYWPAKPTSFVKLYLNIRAHTDFQSLRKYKL